MFADKTFSILTVNIMKQDCDNRRTWLGLGEDQGICKALIKASGV